MSSQQFSPDQQAHAGLGPLTTALEFTQRNFDDPALEWWRLFSEVLGTFLLVLVGAGGAEPRADLGVRSGGLHHPRWALVEPDQRGLDESGPLFWPGSGAARLLPLLGIHRGTDRWWAPGRRHRLPLEGPRWEDYNRHISM